MHQTNLLAETCGQILREQQPNFLRLYLNPFVAQTCFCLDRYVRTTWADRPGSAGASHAATEEFQSFLANGVEEALSGALKLARYDQHKTDARSSCLVLDPADRFAGFAFADLASGERVEFLPGVRVLGSKDLSEHSGALDRGSSARSALALVGRELVGVLVLVAQANDRLEIHAAAIRAIVERDRPLVVTCVDRDSLRALRVSNSRGVVREIVPDIVVFDESFVNREVPFSAFSARKSLFAHWNRARNATFHSTTFQPNTVSTLQFMNCVASFDPEFHALHCDELRGALSSVAQRGDWFARYYNPSLYRLIRATGCATSRMRAAGSFFFVGDRAIFDGVSGVACSIRGHNPPTYAEEMKLAEVAEPRSHDTTGDARRDSGENSAYEAELCKRLTALTGLDRVLPAVSGATAVENALKMALVARFPRKHVLALKAGFGGKTLLALTGTANTAYKQRIEPLYAHVHFVDPFAPMPSGELTHCCKATISRSCRPSSSRASAACAAFPSRCSVISTPAGSVMDTSCSSTRSRRACIARVHSSSHARSVWSQTSCSLARPRRT